MNNLRRARIGDLQEKIRKIYKQNVEENKKMTSQQKEMMSNSKLKCKVCEQFGYEYYVQTRSADEAATKFFMCINQTCKLYKVPKKISD